MNKFEIKEFQFTFKPFFAECFGARSGRICNFAIIIDNKFMYCFDFPHL